MPICIMPRCRYLYLHSASMSYVYLRYASLSLSICVMPPSVMPL